MTTSVSSMDDLKEIPIGELNDISFDMESPLVTNDFNGKSLLSGLLEKHLGRESVFDNKRPHKGIVLLSAKAVTKGIHWLPNLPFLNKKVMRNFAVVRVPETHGHIPSPNMEMLRTAQAEHRNQASGELPVAQKVLISMHDAYFSSPLGENDMKMAKPADIVLIDGDGLIIQIVEPAEIGWAARAVKLGKQVFGNFMGGGGDCREGYKCGKEDPSAISPYGLRAYTEDDTWQPEGFEIHITVGFDSVQNTVDVLARRGVSYHYIVTKDGTAHMIIDPELGRAVHSAATNSTKIGISLTNLGHGMEKNTKNVSRDSWTAADGYMHLHHLGYKVNEVNYPANWAEAYTGAPKPDPNGQPQSTSGWWEKFPEAQLRGLANLCGELQSKFENRGYQMKYFSGHEDSTDSKADPGPMFTKQGGWDKIRDATSNMVRGPGPASTKNTDIDTQQGQFDPGHTPST